MAGQKVTARDGPTWAEQFARLPNLQAVVADDGSGLAKGLLLDNARRHHVGQSPIEVTLDVFHTIREGQRALRATWREATRALERAEAAQKTRDQKRREGQSAQGYASAASKRWGEAEAAWTRAEAAEVAWHQVKSALELFTPQGRLNDRCQAQAVVTGALPALVGGAWDKTRRTLMRPETLRFLDQVQKRLGDLGLAPEVLEALLDLEGWPRQPWRDSAAVRAWALARRVFLSRACGDWRAEACRVAAVVRGVWRASSLVECVNSVARMQQARHRKMTQGLLDLKRLYWNLRRFRTGRRKGQTPYGLLGLKLPELSFGEFLQLDPAELRKQLSGQLLPT